MGPGTRCFQYQWVPTANFQNTIFNDKSAILLHPGTQWNKNLWAKDAGCAGNKITANTVKYLQTCMSWKSCHRKQIWYCCRSIPVSNQTGPDIYHSLLTSCFIITHLLPFVFAVVFFSSFFPLLFKDTITFVIGKLWAYDSVDLDEITQNALSLQSELFAEIRFPI